MSTATLQPPPPELTPSTPRVSKRRPALPIAHGEPAIWVMGAALVIALAMILGIFALIITEGSRTFWPRPIERLTLTDNQIVLGVPVSHDEDAARTLYRTGNRDIGQAPFRWINDTEIKSKDLPSDAVLLERTDWGIWLGQVQSVHEQQADSKTVLAQGDTALPKLRELMTSAQATRDQITTLEHTRGNIDRQLEDTRLSIKKAELDAQRTTTARPPFLSWLGVALTLAAAVALGALAFRIARLKPHNNLQRTVYSGARALTTAAALALILLSALESPASAPTMSAERLAQVKANAATHITDLEHQYQANQQKITELREQDARLRVVVTEPTTNHIAPTRQSSPDDPMLVSQVVRIVPANDLSTTDKLSVYFSRWWEFLSAPPRASNTEGGVFPVIFGTVTLTILLAVAVVPLGVIAALYLREYARQGPLVSLIRIAVNNLAGVPSVVYGVFGLGFFAYSVGAYIDSGPALAAPRSMWWWGIAGCCILIALAFSLAVYAKGIPDPKRRNRTRSFIGLTWLAAVILAIWAVWSTPYFQGFYAEKLPTSTFGTRGILWASLTLALLTLPVVIVATEEAIAAVPRSVREGSYGCGASKWQTVRQIVLPQALPGIMTGAILAMARGAGEVAPLMLVGAVKWAEELPIDSQFPYIHGERSFMHLGFHIFDLGFQSPDSEAARPLVWTTTLLLVLIVLALNLTAIIIRARLRAKVINASV